MLKKVKWILAILGAFILCLGAYILYEFKFKTYEVADEEVSKIIDEQYTIQLPDEQGVVGGNNDLDSSEAKSEKLYITDNLVLMIENDKVISVQDNKGNVVTDSLYKPNMTIQQIETGQKEIVSEVGEVVKVVDTKIPVGAIKEKYTPSIEALEQQAEERLNQLISHAKSEYNEKKANDESVSVGYFYTKYMESSASLESNTDMAFENLLAVIEQDLLANGYEQSEAQIFKDEYEKQKEALRASLKSKALSAIR